MALSVVLLLGAVGCGGSGSAAASKTQDPALLGQQLEDLVSQVGKMGIVEWHGELLTKDPDKGGQPLLDLSSRFSPSTGYSQVSMTSTLGGKAQQVDYLVINGRTYFNSEDWGPEADGCWADITGDAVRSWGLPTELDPAWSLSGARPLKLAGDDVDATLPFKAVLAGMPRGLFPTVPSVPYDTEARAVIAPHGHLIEVGIDLVSLWKSVPDEQRASLETRRAGWWLMTMKKSPDDDSIAPPKYVFDPAVTPPSQCTRAPK
ncbi:hypothetical protein J2X46_004820 [Nocardioides sp. BE266]|uniref:hypothetical protein n=1 Tax=Nocardioides sp. BE266 TaxID=2817725 RepID=UPI00285884EE|nr:hypothetical protein [Nocardioides sp. BE266]MDR7255802.1 hypothetical protein [Nocardioides sp. BE266]